MDEFLTVFGPTWALTVEEVLCAMLVSFVLCSMIAFVYRKTDTGFSSSRAFVHTLILSGLLTAMLIMAIGNNLARGLGILGTLAIIRFRTPIRDPRDIIFLFATLACGIAAGANVYTVGIVGSTFFCAVAIYLHWSPFASRRQYDAMLRFTIPPKSPHEDNIRRVMEDCCDSFHLIAMREAAQGEVLEYSYQVRLVDPSYHSQLLDGIRRHSEDASLIMQRSTIEI